jgi:hypothetical protein
MHAKGKIILHGPIILLNDNLDSVARAAGIAWEYIQ